MPSKPSKTDHDGPAESWDAERAFNRVRVAVIRMQAKETPTDSMLVCRDRQLRVSLCANGTLPADLYEQARKQLHRHGHIAYGERYLCYPHDAQMAREAIQYVAEQEPVDREFIGRMNQLLSEGAFDNE